jgi:hypothetical protein
LTSVRVQKTTVRLSPGLHWKTAKRRSERIDLTTLAKGCARCKNRQLSEVSETPSNCMDTDTQDTEAEPKVLEQALTTAACKT